MTITPYIYLKRYYKTFNLKWMYLSITLHSNYIIYIELLGPQLFYEEGLILRIQPEGINLDHKKFSSLGPTM